MSGKPQLVDAETNTIKKETANAAANRVETRGRKPKFNSEEERHASVLESKRRYYARNAELSRLKSCRYYYIRQLKRDDLDERKKDKYERKLRETVYEINEFVNKTDSTDSTDSSESSQSSSV